MDEKRVKSFWDKRAKMKTSFYPSITEFDDSSEGAKRNHLELEKVLTHVSKGETVLDLGCGTGRYCKVLSKVCRHVVGVDYSKPMLEVARRLNSAKNIDYVLEDVTKFRSKRKFDTILICGLFIYMNDKSIAKMMANVRKMLKKEGTIYFRGSVGIEKKKVLENVYSAKLKSNYNATYRTIPEHHKIFVKHGFRPISVETLYQHWKDTKQAQIIYKPERIIGILGGMGPLASLDLYNKILDNCGNVEKDWEYPRVIIDSNTKIPSRGMAYSLGEESPEEDIEESLENLKRQCDIVVVACNSAHKWFKPDDKVKSIIDIVIQKVKEDGLKKVGLLASRVVTESKLYEGKGVEIIYPENPEIIYDLIYRTKLGKKEKVNLSTIFQQDIEAILGCTELPLLEFDTKTYDVNDIVAKYLVRWSRYEI